MDLQIGNASEVGIGGDKPQVILKGVGGDPIIWIGQGDALLFQRRSDPGVNKRGHFIGIEALESGQIFLGFEQRAGTGFRE